MLNILKEFHFHKYRKFKIGGFPLVAAICEKCGKIKDGNSVYCDGSVYQNSYKGQKAKEYIDKLIKYVLEYHKGIAQLSENFEDYLIKVAKAKMEEHLSTYENWEIYTEIKKYIK